MILQEKDHLINAISTYRRCKNKKHRNSLKKCVEDLQVILENKIEDSYYHGWCIKDRIIGCKIFLRLTNENPNQT